MSLRLLIDNSAPGDVAPQTVYPSADFIQAALRAAKHSKQTTREAILTDICDILACTKADLAFLFADNTGSTPFHFPNYRREQTFLEAAE